MARADFVWRNDFVAVAIWTMDGAQQIGDARSLRAPTGSLPTRRISMLTARRTSCGATISARAAIWELNARPMIAISR